MKHIEATPTDVRKFGYLFAGIFIALAAFSLYKGTELWKWMLCGSAFFLLTGVFIQPVLKPIYIGWMMLAFALGWINTRIILGLVFYLIFTPAGVLMRLFRKDILVMKIDKNATSYWIKREPSDRDAKQYEQLF